METAHSRTVLAVGLAVTVVGCGGESALTVTMTRDFADARALPDAAFELADAATDATIQVTCGETSTDFENCGRCGHDCQGGTCVAGVCQPVKIAAAAACVLALDAQNVYFAAADPNGQALMAEPTNGGTARVVTSCPHDVTGIAVDTDNLYFSRAVIAGPGVNTYTGSVSRVPLGGGAPTTLASGNYRPSAISVRGADVYFTTRWISTFDPADQTPKGSVMKVQAGAVSTLVTGLQDATEIATDSTDVYWLETFGAGCSWGCVVRMPLVGGAPTTVVGGTAANEVFKNAFALSGADVYWTNQGPSAEVAKQPTAGGTAVTLASNQNEPNAIAVDDTGVYWTTGASIMKVQRAGGAVTALAIDQCRPCAIATNSTSIFWVTCDSVMRIAK